ncbi:MAG: hypothetical protein IH945_03165 [Armatimonadetes bacterium]|nr:hypothetical protein [Armatimonadota bacterium]
MKPPKKKLKRWVIVVPTVILLLVGGFFVYRAKFSQPKQAEIDAAMAAQDWRRAAALIERANLSTDAGENYYSMGVAYSRLGNSTKAIAAYMEADDLDYRRPEARFQIAALYAADDERELSLRWLEDALDVGFPADGAVLSDSRLDSLRGSDKFNDLLDPPIDRGPDGPAGLDFLLGKWSIASRPGIASSTVTYSRLTERNGIGEAWSGTAPGGASGMFVRDPETGRWTYAWVDGAGRVFRGNVRIGQQVTIAGTMMYMDGTEIKRQIEIRKSGSLLDYLIRDSRDGGKSWDQPIRRRLSLSGSKPSF